MTRRGATTLPRPARRAGRLAIVIAACLLWAPASRAAPAGTAPASLTLEEAVQFALQNAPASRVALEGKAVAQAGTDLARTGYLPQLDALWQSNRATHNNTAGLLLPQAVVPPVSGPVEPAADSAAVWGSAAGLLLSWEPFDFGRRRAAVLAATSSETRAAAEESLARLEIATAAADAFLGVVAAEEQARAAEADVERRQVLARSIHALAASQLRPDADVSRAEAELAGARISFIRSQEQERRARASLAGALGIAGADLTLVPGPLLDAPPPAPPAGTAAEVHPLAAAIQARADEAASRVRVEARSYVPQVRLQASWSARGSGVNPDGTVSDGTSGLGLDRDNWAVGLTLSFHILDFEADHARERIEDATWRAMQALHDQSLQDLATLEEKARASWESARLVAENTPTQLQAARTNETQVRARYDAGLGTITEVADAQRVLVQAEIEDSLARLGVWHALLQLDNAEGDLRPFFHLLAERTTGDR